MYRIYLMICPTASGGEEKRFPVSSPSSSGWEGQGEGLARSEMTGAKMIYTLEGGNGRLPRRREGELESFLEHGETANKLSRR